MQRLPLFVGLVLFAFISISMTVFTVDQRQFALVFQLGEIKRVIHEPGLKFKLPLIQNVRFYDKRILTLDTSEPELFQTAEKKNVLVDLYVKWQIADPALYYRSFSGEESRARNRLDQTVTSGLREEFGRRTVHRNNATTFLGANSIGREALAIGQVVDLNLLVFTNTGFIKQTTINGTGTFIFQLGMGNTGLMQLGFEHGELHE